MSQTLDRFSGGARALPQTELAGRVRRFFDVVPRETDRSVPELIEAVMLEVTEWTGEQGLRDDMTMLVARRC